MVLDGRGRILGRAYGEIRQFYPRPGWVEHDPEQIYRIGGAARPRGDRGLAHPAGRHRRDGNHQSARDVRGVGTAKRPPGASRDRMAMPAQRRDLRRARPARGRGSPAHRAADRSLLLRHQAQVAARQRPHAAPARGPRRTVLRHDRLMADIPALARRRIRDRLYQCVAHHDAQSQGSARGTPRCCGCSAYRPRCCPSRSARAVRWPKRPPARSGRAPYRSARSSAINNPRSTANARSARRGKATYGTGAFLLMHTGQRAVASRNRLLTTAALGPAGEPAYALEGSVFIAGAAIQWLRDEMRMIATSAESEKLARASRDRSQPYLVPAFVGLGAPYWDAGARGAIVGITRGTNRADVVRAALDSIAYQVRDALAAMEKDSGQRVANAGRRRSHRQRLPDAVSGRCSWTPGAAAENGRDYGAGSGDAGGTGGGPLAFAERTGGAGRERAGVSPLDASRPSVSGWSMDGMRQWHACAARRCRRRAKRGIDEHSNRQ